MEGFIDYVLTQLWEELLLVLLLALPLLMLLTVCLLTLNELPPQRRRGLFALFFTLLALAAALFGGAAVLGHYGLAWRTWFQVGLGAVLWLVGLGTGTLTVAYGGRWLRERGGFGRIAVGLSTLCLASAMVVGTAAGGLWCLGPIEQVATYDGQRVILGTWVSSRNLYAYHGPLVRGKEPMLVDWDEALLEGTMGW